MQRLATALVVFAAVATAPVTLQAQDRGFGIAGSAGVFIPGGEDLEELDAGFGAEGVLSWGWASGFEIGAGVHWSSHDAEGSDTATEDEGADLFGLFGEAGWRFNSRPANSAVVMPFVKARGGYLRADVDSADEEEADVEGWSLGGQAGLEVWLSRAFAITGVATLDYVSFEGDEIDPTAERSTGTLVGITGGVKIRLN